MPDHNEICCFLGRCMFQTLDMIRLLARKQYLNLAYLSHDVLTYSPPALVASKIHTLKVTPWPLTLSLRNDLKFSTVNDVLYKEVSTLVITTSKLL